jgi:hypothetical protein
MEEATDTYCPGTLPPRLFQSNPFARQQNDDETSTIAHELTAREVPATEKEIQALAEEEEENIALSQAIDTMLTTRAGRKRKTTPKVVQNAVLEKQLKRAKMGGGSSEKGLLFM